MRSGDVSAVAPHRGPAHRACRVARRPGASRLPRRTAVAPWILRSLRVAVSRPGARRAEAAVSTGPRSAVRWGRVIDTPDALVRLSRELFAVPVIGFDTEGDGLYRYRSRLCTVQIAHPRGVAIVDTLAIADPSPLAPLLGSEGPEKVLHDCAFDARLLARAGLRLRRVFDTAIAARFLGEVSTGLAALLQRYLGRTIGKEFQEADWGRRPLTPEEIAYLEADVMHLVPLASLLRERCAQLGILEEVRVESEWAAGVGADEDDGGVPPWVRIKGAHELRTGAQRAVLRELAALRERLAEEADVPPFRVLPNAALLHLARCMPRDRAALDRVASLARRPDLARPVIDAIRRGLDAGEVPPEELAILRPPPPPPGEREARRRRERALAAWRAQAAAERGVGAQVVLPGHCLRELAARGPRSEEELRAIPGLGECRIERYGRALLDVLAAA
jgi:ribonuclease D